MLIYVMLLFILSISAIIFLYNKNVNSKRMFSFIAFMLFFLVSALRSSEIGVDTSNYVILFNNLQGMSIQQILNWNIYYEKGYMIFNHIIQYLSLNDQILIVITSLIIIFSIVRLVHIHSPATYLSLFLFITMAYYYSSMNILRQYLAMSILTFSLKFAKERKLVPFVLIVLLASLFHTTAWVFLIVYLFPKINFSLKKVIIILTISVTSTVFLFPIIEFIIGMLPQYKLHENYFESNELASLIKAFILIIILLLGMLVITNKNKKSTINYKRGLHLSEGNIIAHQSTDGTSYESIFSFIILTATAISIMAIRMSILGRVSEYFAVYIILYLPIIIKKIENKNLRMITTYVVVLISLIHNIIIFIYRPEWYEVTPYLFFWEN